ncbi:unnamed protein product, partial [Amoebophrya sp. A25]
LSSSGEQEPQNEEDNVEDFSTKPSKNLDLEDPPRLPQEQEHQLDLVHEEIMSNKNSCSTSRSTRLRS